MEEDDKGMGRLMMRTRATWWVSVVARDEARQLPIRCRTMAYLCLRRTYSPAQYSPVQSSTVQSSTVRYSAVQYSAVQSSTDQ